MSFYPSLACPQQMPLFIKASKTDAFCQGHTLITACSTSLVCPVTTMHDYYFSDCPHVQAPFHFQSGHLLTKLAVVNLHRDAARHASLPFKTFKGHSFGNGAASNQSGRLMAAALIKVLSRWSSDCYQLYICTPRNLLLSAVPQMASVSYF